MLKAFFKLKYNEHDINCPFCKNHVRVKYYSKTYHRVYLTCGHYINPFKGTPFFMTRIPLDKLWNFLKEFSSRSCSCAQAGRSLGISVMGAWYLLKRIREAMKIKNELGDTVWIDETFFGSPKKNARKQKLTEQEVEEYKKLQIKLPRIRKDLSKEKGVLFGISYGHYNYNIFQSKITCEGMKELKSFHLDEWERRWREILIPLQGKVKNVIHDGDPKLSKIIRSLGFNDYFVSHSKNKYVVFKDGIQISTNIIEGFFGRLKRSFNGLHTYASKKYLPLYINEFSWRSTIKGKTFEDFLHCFI